jgi:hypothetical protein
MQNIVIFIDNAVSQASPQVYLQARMLSAILFPIRSMGVMVVWLNAIERQ